MIVPKCEWRTAMPAQGVFHCAHQRVVATPGNFISARVCKDCQRYCEPNPNPRPLPEINPTFWRRAKNYTAAGIQHLLAGKKEAPEGVPEKRESICKGGCPYWNGKSCEHKACGCGSRKNGMQEKWRWADSSCPVGKWGPEFDV